MLDSPKRTLFFIIKVCSVVVVIGLMWRLYTNGMTSNVCTAEEFQDNTVEYAADQIRNLSKLNRTEFSHMLSNISMKYATSLYNKGTANLNFAVPSANRRKYILFLTQQGGLGNQMFQAANLYGISQKIDRIPVLVTSQLFKIFPNLRKYIASQSPAFICTGKKLGHIRYMDISLRMTAIFDSNEFDNSFPPVDLQIFGPFHTVSYFRTKYQEIRSLYEFGESLTRAAEMDIKSITDNVRKQKNKFNATFTYVGVHVQRPDHVAWQRTEKGRTYPDTGYFKHAMDYYRRKYGNVIFLVASNDFQWCKDNLHPVNKSDIYFLPERSGPEHLSTLTQCNHTIMTTGTFGFWASFLAGGDTVYFNDVSFKAAQSKHAEEYRRYPASHLTYLPHWVTMSNDF